MPKHFKTPYLPESHDLRERDTISRKIFWGKAPSGICHREDGVSKETIKSRSGMLLTLRMELPEEKMPLEIEQAVVQWVSGEDFGVRIKKIRRSAAIKLERLMGHHLCILPPVEH
jgi:hypothetical protein